MPREQSGRKSMPLVFDIADLRHCPEFFDAVADRIWQAWWKPHGHPLTYIRDRLREHMEPGPIPLALVAHEDGHFLGAASDRSSSTSSSVTPKHEACELSRSPP